MVEPSFWAIVGGLLFGFPTALAEAQRRARLDDKARARMGPFLRRLRRGNVDGYAWLLRVLAKMDGRTPRRVGAPWSPWR